MTRVTIPACSAVARIMHPGSVKYTFGFETAGVDSWTNMSALMPSPASRCHRGIYVGYSSLAAGTQHRTRTITGLTIGRSYTLSAWAGAQLGSPSTTFAVGVSGIGASTPAAGVTPTFDIIAWKKFAYTFTATATSHTAQLTSVSAGTCQTWWDDILVVENEYQVGADIPLDLLPGSTVTLDERTSPYAVARLAIALPDQADLDLLDTRTVNRPRVIITASQTFVSPVAAPQTRVFNLLLHERDSDDATDRVGTVLTCRSDEAILIDGGNETTTADSTMLLDQKSLRAIISTKLESLYSALEPGTADADFTVTTALINELPNPDFETNATGWVRSTTNCTIARSTAQSYGGGASLLCTATGAGSLGFFRGTVTTAPFPQPVVEGRTYTFMCAVTSNVAKNVTPSIRWGNSTTTVGSDAVGTVLNTAGILGAWQPISVTGVAPPGATNAAPWVSMASVVAGNVMYADSCTFYEGAYGQPYHGGDNSPDAYYSYAWEGTAHASRSLRIRLDARDPQLLIQDPGEKDWDILQQLVQVAGLRLFCDELRRWYLVDPATYTPAGTLALEGALRGRDRISREADDWCDAVVVKYTWIGLDGTPQIAYDAATAGGTLLRLVEWNRPYPGPGAAAAILARYQGRGRVQELVAPAELAALPAMALTTALPNTPAQEGFASRVTFDLDEFSMTVGARDLVDA